MAKGLFIEWKVDWSPPEAAVKLSRTFYDVNLALFQNKKIMESFWNTTRRKIARYIKDHFDKQGPGWKPLSSQYLEWKKRAVSKGYKKKTGSLGKKKAKYTQIGKLTGTLAKTAEGKTAASIFRTSDTPNFQGGAFEYSINLDKLPYAEYFDKEREFFYLKAEEADKVMKELHAYLWRKFRQKLRA